MSRHAIFARCQLGVFVSGGAAAAYRPREVGPGKHWGGRAVKRDSMSG